MTKYKEWLRRYLPAEAFAYVLTFLTIGFTDTITGDSLKAAIYGTWAGIIGYYLLFLIRQIYDSKTNLNTHGHKYSKANLRHDLVRILIEFGPGSVVRFTLIYTPLIMGTMMKVVGDEYYGQLITTVLADYILFYIITVFMYEKLKKYDKMVEKHHHEHH